MTTAKNKGGRPRAEVDYTGVIARMAKIALTEIQMAMVLDVDLSEVEKYQGIIESNLPKGYMRKRWFRLARLHPYLATEFNRLYRVGLNADPPRRIKHAVYAQIQARYGKKYGMDAGAAINKLPFTFVELSDHLERLFNTGMTWDNYGTWWEIDHKKPCSMFDIKTSGDADFQACWGLDNLQPLERSENRAKGNKYVQT